MWDQAVFDHDAAGELVGRGGVEIASLAGAVQVGVRGGGGAGELVLPGLAERDGDVAEVIGRAAEQLDLLADADTEVGRQVGAAAAAGARGGQEDTGVQDAPGAVLGRAGERRVAGQGACRGAAAAVAGGAPGGERDGVDDAGSGRRTGQAGISEWSSRCRSARCTSKTR